MYVSGWLGGCVIIVATIPYSWFHAVNLLTFDNRRNMWRKKQKHFGLEIFFSQKFLYLVYPTEKTALFYTIFIQYIPLCNCNGHLEFLLVRRRSKSQYFYRQWILHWICRSNEINRYSYLNTCEWDSVYRDLNGYFRDVDLRVVYHCLETDFNQTSFDLFLATCPTSFMHRPRE